MPVSQGEMWRTPTVGQDRDGGSGVPGVLISLREMSRTPTEMILVRLPPVVSDVDGGEGVRLGVHVPVTGLLLDGGPAQRGYQEPGRHVGGGEWIDCHSGHGSLLTHSLVEVVHLGRGEESFPSEHLECGVCPEVEPEAEVPPLPVREVELLAHDGEGDGDVVVQPGPYGVGLEGGVPRGGEDRAPHYVAGPLDPGAGLQDGDEDCDHRAGLGVGSPLLKNVGEVGPLSLGGELGPLRGWDRLGPDREHSVLDCLGCHSERKMYCVGDFDVTILIIAHVFLGVCVARLVYDCIPSRPF